MSKYKSIAIDGPSGAGKSTIAKKLSEKLNFIYIDTGALYRAIGLYMINNDISPADQNKVTENLKNINIELKYENKNQQVFLNNINISDQIRSPEVSMAASTVSAFKSVRNFLLGLQRDIAKNNNVIMDGRDIATVVLPNADVKIFLTASSKIRAKRRYDELTNKNINVIFDDVYNDMLKRDQDDSSREIAPLKQADDAILVDSSEMDFDETLSYILAIIRENLN